MIRRPPRSTRTATLFPYTTLVRSEHGGFPARRLELAGVVDERAVGIEGLPFGNQVAAVLALAADAGHHLFVGQELARAAGEHHLRRAPFARSAEPREGKECVITVRSRWCPLH